jgi:hypothetical protein
MTKMSELWPPHGIKARFLIKGSGVIAGRVGQLSLWDHPNNHATTVFIAMDDLRGRHPLDQMVAVYLPGDVEAWEEIKD